MRLVVTGAAGFIGANIVCGLNRLGLDDVIAVDDLTDGSKFRNLADARISDYFDRTEFYPRFARGEFGKVDAVMHQGAIVAMGRPEALLAGLGPELVELRVGKDPDGALAAMRARGLAAGDAFAIGSTLTIPLGSHSARDTITAIASLGIDTEAMTTRKPTLDDVYLQLTGSRLAA